MDKKHFRLNLQLFAEDSKNPYDVLLERIDNMEKEIETLKKENKDVMDMNRALLNRQRPADKPQDEDNKIAREKLNKYLEE